METLTEEIKNKLKQYKDVTYKEINDDDEAKTFIGTVGNKYRGASLRALHEDYGIPERTTRTCRKWVARNAKNASTEKVASTENGAAAASSSSSSSMHQMHDDQLQSSMQQLRIDGPEDWMNFKAESDKLIAANLPTLKKTAQKFVEDNATSFRILIVQDASSPVQVNFAHSNFNVFHASLLTNEKATSMLGMQKHELIVSKKKRTTYSFVDRSNEVFKWAYNHYVNLADEASKICGGEELFASLLFTWEGSVLIEHFGEESYNNGYFSGAQVAQFLKAEKQVRMDRRRAVLQTFVRKHLTKKTVEQVVRGDDLVKLQQSKYLVLDESVVTRLVEAILSVEFPTRYKAIYSLIGRQRALETFGPEKNFNVQGYLNLLRQFMIPTEGLYNNEHMYVPKYTNKYIRILCETMPKERKTWFYPAPKSGLSGKHEKSIIANMPDLNEDLILDALRCQWTLEETRLLLYREYSKRKDVANGSSPWLFLVENSAVEDVDFLTDFKCSKLKTVNVRRLRLPDEYCKVWRHAECETLFTRTTTFLAEILDGGLVESWKLYRVFSSNTSGLCSKEDERLDYRETPIGETLQMADMVLAYDAYKNFGNLSCEHCKHVESSRFEVPIENYYKAWSEMNEKWEKYQTDLLEREIDTTNGTKFNNSYAGIVDRVFKDTDVEVADLAFNLFISSTERFYEDFDKYRKSFKKDDITVDCLVQDDLLMMRFAHGLFSPLEQPIWYIGAAFFYLQWKKFLLKELAHDAEACKLALEHHAAYLEIWTVGGWNCDFDNIAHSLAGHRSLRLCRACGVFSRDDTCRHEYFPVCETCYNMGVFNRRSGLYNNVTLHVYERKSSPERPYQSTGFENAHWHKYKDVQTRTLRCEGRFPVDVMAAAQSNAYEFGHLFQSEINYQPHEAHIHAWLAVMMQASGRHFCRRSDVEWRGGNVQYCDLRDKDGTDCKFLETPDMDRRWIVYFNRHFYIDNSDDKKAMPEWTEQELKLGFRAHEFELNDSLFLPQVMVIKSPIQASSGRTYIGVHDASTRRCIACPYHALKKSLKLDQ